MGIFQHFFDGSFRGDFAAALSGAGSHVNQIVGSADGVFVMLDDNYGVADVAQAGKGGKQAVVVSLMQTYRRFVKNIEHAGQSGADLGSQTDALGFAAGKGS